MAHIVVLFPCGVSAQEVQNEPQSNSHACLGRRHTMETEETDDNKLLTVSVFSSDLSLLVASAPEATERLALHLQVFIVNVWNKLP